jgi:nitrite reductase (NO-forming)
MSRIRVAHFEDGAQAEAVRQRLTQAGIHADIHRKSGLAKLWYVSKNRAGIRVEVHARDAERARCLLLGWIDQYESVVRCPECRSLQVDFPQFTQKSFLTNVTMGLVAEIGLIEREYYCEDCHCMWAKPGSRQPSARPHMAPDYFLEGLAHQPAAAEGHVGALHGRAAAGHLEDDRAHQRSTSAGATQFGWRRRWALIAAMLLCLANHGRTNAAQAPTATAQPTATHAENPTYLRDVQPILMGKCVRCHNDESHIMQNWLDYRTASADRWEIKRRIWDSWKGAYFKQPMPTANSPEHEAITDEERTIIRSWVESGAPRGVRPVFAGGQSKAQRVDAGRRLFASICATCHQPTGQGIPGRFPPLAGSDFLNSDKHRAIKIVVNGLQGEVMVNGQKFNSSMPRFPLSDEEIACALTYVFNSFGNSGKDVTPQEVSSVRVEKNDIDGLNVGAKAPEEKSPYE